MFHRKPILNRWMLGSLACLLLLETTALPAMADQSLRRPGDRVAVTLKTPIDGETAQTGETFEAELAEPLHYQQWTLPAGTRFSGQITKTGHSRIFDRPGYVALQAEEATLPDGRIFSFTGNDYAPRSRKIRNSESLTLPESVGKQAPYWASGLGVTVPLWATGAVTNGSLLAIGLGVRMLTGAITGPFRKTGDFANKSAGYKVARNALEASGIPNIVHFVAVKDPEVSLASGDTIRLRFDPDAMNALFRQAATPTASTSP